MAVIKADANVLVTPASGAPSFEAILLDIDAPGILLQRPTLDPEFWPMTSIQHIRILRDPKKKT